MVPCNQIMSHFRVFLFCNSKFIDQIMTLLDSTIPPPPPPPWTWKLFRWQNLSNHCLLKWLQQNYNLYNNISAQFGLFFFVLFSVQFKIILLLIHISKDKYWTNIHCHYYIAKPGLKKVSMNLIKIFIFLLHTHCRTTSAQLTLFPWLFNKFCVPFYSFWFS